MPLPSTPIPVWSLEHLYSRARDGIVLSIGELARYFEQMWQANSSNDVVILEPEATQATYRAIGKRCLRDYSCSNACYASSVSWQPVLTLQDWPPFLAG